MMLEEVLDEDQLTDLLGGIDQRHPVLLRDGFTNLPPLDYTHGAPDGVGSLGEATELSDHIIRR